jgi:hypothetical protein
MNDQHHEPAYRAAIESAHAELRQIGETLNQLRARQEQIYSAAEALELLVSPADARRPVSTAKPVYSMGNPTQQAPVEKVRATA